MRGACDAANVDTYQVLEYRRKIQICCLGDNGLWAEMGSEHHRRTSIADFRSLVASNCMPVPKSYNSKRPMSTLKKSVVASGRVQTTNQVFVIGWVRVDVQTLVVGKS